MDNGTYVSTFAMRSIYIIEKVCKGKKRAKAVNRKKGPTINLV